MTKTKRRVLFYALVLLFLMGGGAVALYAQGWRLDLAHRRLTQVGGIYVRSFPPDVKITLDGRSANGSRRFFFENGFLLNDLFPKSYILAIEKEGYRPWRRTVAVSPAAVAEVRYAVLVPEYAAVASGTPALGALRVFDDDVLASGGPFLLARDGKTGRSFFEDTRRATSTDVAALLRRAERFLGSQPRRFLVDSAAARIVMQGTRTIAAADVAADTVILVTPSTFRDIVSAVAVLEGRIAYAASGNGGETSSVYLYEPTSRRTETIAAAIPGKTAEIAWIDDGRLAVLQGDGALYRLDVRTGTFQGIASDVRTFAFTPDGAQVAAAGRSSMEAISMDDKAYWRFNLPDAASVKHLSWYADGRHLFVHYPDRVMFLDLEDTGLENLTPVAETTQGTYDARTNVFYFLADSRLRKVEFP